MSTYFGQTPSDNVGANINTKNLADLRQSGFYKVTVANTFVKDGVSSKGKAWQSLTLTLAVLEGDEYKYKASQTIFINNNSQTLQDLCYFANLRDPQTHAIYCPDATVISYTDKSTNEPKQIKKIEELENLNLFAFIVYIGEKQASNGNSYPDYDIKICNRFGQTATEEATKRAPSVLTYYVNMTKAQLPAWSEQQNVQQLNNRVGGTYQQAPKPQAQPQQNAYAQQQQNPYAQAIDNASQQQFNKAVDAVNNMQAFADDADVPF